jgi:hypothetical protein
VWHQKLSGFAPEARDQQLPFYTTRHLLMWMHARIQKEESLFFACITVGFYFDARDQAKHTERL